MISQQMLEDIKKSPYDLKQIITMASLIEKESIGDDTERKNISSVIHNRLETPTARRAAGRCSCAPPSTISWCMTA